MNKKSASQFAFFNLRVLIGLFVFLAGVFVVRLPVLPGAPNEANGLPWLGSSSQI
jgi:hypothetical protein